MKPLLTVLLAVVGFVRADTIELMNGNKVEGKVLATDAAAKTVSIEALIGGQTIKRTLPQTQVHALTVNGQRTVITVKAGTALAASSGVIPGGGAAAMRSSPRITRPARLIASRRRG